jgi:WD40 repeat protein
VAFPHAGRSLLATGGADGSVRLWDLGARRRLACWEDHMLSVRDLTVLEDGPDPLVVSAGADGTLRRWAPGAGAVGPPVHCDQQGVHAVAAVPVAHGEPPLIASGGEDGTVRLWEARTLRPAGDALRAADGPVTALACFRCPAGRPHLAATGPGGTVHLWDVTARTRLLRVVTGSPLNVLQAGRGTGTDPGRPVLLAAGKAGLSVFAVHLERS